MDKIKLKICMGTMCYVMGGAELKDFIETLSQEIKQHLEISFSSCLGYCNEKQDPPFIELNGKMLAGISKSNLMQILKEEIRNAIR